MNYNYGSSLRILKQRLASDKLWNNLKEYFGSLDKLLPYLTEYNIVEDWRGFKISPATSSRTFWC